MTAPKLEMEQDLEACPCDCHLYGEPPCGQMHTRRRAGAVDRFFVDGRAVTREEFVAAGGDDSGIPSRIPRS